MLLLTDNRPRMRKSFGRILVSAIGLAIVSYLSTAAYLPAQIPSSPPANAEPSVKIDPLGRRYSARVIEHRATEAFRFPGESSTRTK
jgi:hypothetical protein